MKKNELEILSMMELMDKLNKFISSFSEEKKKLYKDVPQFGLADVVEVALFQTFTKFVLGNPDPQDLKEKIKLYSNLLGSLGILISDKSSLSEKYEKAIKEAVKKFTEKESTELN